MEINLFMSQNKHIQIFNRYIESKTLPMLIKCQNISNSEPFSPITGKVHATMQTQFISLLSIVTCPRPTSKNPVSQCQS